MANALLIDYEYCTGCHACEVSCKKEKNLARGQWGIKILTDGPRELPDDKWEFNNIPMPTSLCDLCAERLESGKDPSCVHNCPANCMQFGTVEEMSKEVTKKGNRVIFVPVV